MYSFLRQNHTKDWIASVGKVIKGINQSKHKSIFGLRPFDVNDPLEGTFIIQRAREKFGDPVDKIKLPLAEQEAERKR